MSTLFLKSLVAGAAEGAGESIEKRNTEIRKNAMAEFEILRREAGEKTEKLQTKRDELTSMAGALSSYRDGQGVQLTETQITGLLMQPVKAKQILKTLESEKDLSSVDFSKLLKVGGKVEMAPEEYIKRTTSIPQGLPQTQPTQVPKGAFGLSSPAYGEAQQQFEAASGRKLSDVRAMALTAPERIEAVPLEVDLSQFKNPETITNITGKIRDNVANGIPLSDPRNEKGLKQLQANSILTDMFDKKGEGEDKPRSASAINAVFTKALSVSVSPWVRNNTVRLVPETGDYVPVGGTASDVDAFQKQKNDTIRKQAEAIGILDKKGKVLGGRNSFDALIPYANIEDGHIVSWRKPSEETLKEAITLPSTTPAGPKAGAPSSVTAPVEKDISVPSPAILTSDGKGVDGTAMKKTYKPGQRVTMPNGKLKIWNGDTLQ